MYHYLPRGSISTPCAILDFRNISNRNIFSCFLKQIQHLDCQSWLPYPHFTSHDTMRFLIGIRDAQARLLRWKMCNIPNVRRIEWESVFRQSIKRCLHGDTAPLTMPTFCYLSRRFITHLCDTGKLEACINMWRCNDWSVDWIHYKRYVHLWMAGPSIS